MDLAEIQKAVLGVIQQPLTPSEGMRKRTLDGRPVKKIVDQVIKPNDRLTSFERLEIYNRVYWFRLLSSWRPTEGRVVRTQLAGSSSGCRPILRAAG